MRVRSTLPCYISCRKLASWFNLGIIYNYSATKGKTTTENVVKKYLGSAK